MPPEEFEPVAFQRETFDLEEPILRNSQFGYYTTFVNLLDLFAPRT